MVFQRPIIPEFPDGSEDDRPDNRAMTGETSSCKVELSRRSQNKADDDNCWYLARAQRLVANLLIAIGNSRPSPCAPDVPI